MPQAVITPELKAEIARLRGEGVSINRTAEILGISRSVVTKHQPKGQRRSTHWRAEHQEVLDVDEYADVVPIPFYPPDLPDIIWRPWPKSDLEWAFECQRSLLWPLPESSAACNV